MIDFPILTLLILVPLGGVIFLLAMRGDDEQVARNSKWVAFWTALAEFVLSLVLWVQFDPMASGYQFVEQSEWIPGAAVEWYLGLDGISLLFVVLSTFLTLICVISSWNSISQRVREFMMAFLLLETMMVGMFSALDMIVFYLFFEGVLIPMYLIIGVWGGKRRVYAALKFFLYTLLGSVLMLVAIMAMYVDTGTFNIPDLQHVLFDPALQIWLWLAFFASFAVKVPMWPVHTWLPDAHVEAPTAGSVILAGVLLKMGAYGFLRFSLPMFPEACEIFRPLVFFLSIVAVIYTSLVALVQEDIKKLIAYSSVAHMGFVTLGIFSVNVQGLEGALFQMLSHGIVSGALFLCVGVIYDRVHTREIKQYGGLVERMPRYAVAMGVMTMASVGLPATSGFVGEFLVLVGLYQVSTWATLFAATALVLGAAYMLYLYKRVVFGPLIHERLKKLQDLRPHESLVLGTLVLVVLWMGIYPSSFLDIFHTSVADLIQDYQSGLTIGTEVGWFDWLWNKGIK